MNDYQNDLIAAYANVFDCVEDDRGFTYVVFARDASGKIIGVYDGNNAESKQLSPEDLGIDPSKYNEFGELL